MTNVKENFVSEINTAKCKFLYDVIVCNKLTWKEKFEIIFEEHLLHDTDVQEFIAKCTCDILDVIGNEERIYRDAVIIRTNYSEEYKTALALSELIEEGAYNCAETDINRLLAFAASVCANTCENPSDSALLLIDILGRIDIRLHQKSTLIDGILESLAAEIIEIIADVS
jgi:hypothetical protein